MDMLSVVAKKKPNSSGGNPIGRRIVSLREGKFTQTTLAKAIGVHRQTIARIETGSEFNPSLELLQKLAGALGCTVSDLVSEVPTLPSKN